MNAIGILVNAEQAHKRNVQSLTEHRVWSAMIQRCTNPNNPAWPRYGGRGITVCDEWRKFESFYRDMAPRPVGKSLDRINNDSGYSKENCRWATLEQQANNRRLSKMNRTGIAGIAIRRETKMFRVYTYRRGQKNIGHFKSLDDAVHAKLLAEIELGDIAE